MRFVSKSRLGNELSHVSLNGFWASIYQANINAGDYAYDPKLRYDPYNQRWMITVCTGANLANSRVLIGVSQTSDPTQNWNLYAIPSSNSGSVWADQGNIGFNKNWVSVSVNMYSLAVDEAHSQFQRAVLYVVDKVKIYTNNTLSYRAFSDSGSSLVTASTYDNTINPLYVVGKSNGGAASVTLYKIDGAVGAETFNSIANVSTSNGPWINGSTYAVPQLGDSRTIDTDDDRVSSCIYRGGSTNGSIWFTQTISPTSGPARDDIQWWQITPSGNVSQTGRIDDPSGNTFYGYSSIAVNKHNAALIGYTRFSSSQYPSANYSYRGGNDPPGILRADTILHNGLDSYFNTGTTGSGGTNRWGDYSNAAVDPVNDTDLWTIQEYADIRDPSPVYGNSNFSGRWNTWWGQIPLPDGSATSVATSNDGKFHVLWSNSDGSIELWTINTKYQIESSYAYGPYPGYTAKMIAAGPDNHTHVLWNRSDGLLSLWDVDTTGHMAFTNYGPFSGYTASAIAVGGNNIMRVLWNSANGSISLWNIDGTAPSGYSYANYGPFSGYSARAISAGPNSRLRVLWNKTDGSISLWNLDSPTATTYSHVEFGPFGSFNAIALAVDPHNYVRLLWQYPDNSISLWTIDGSTPAGYSFHNYGPYSSWSANAVSIGPDDYLHVLWDRTDGTMSLWSVDTSYNFAHSEYGPF